MRTALCVLIFLLAATQVVGLEVEHRTLDNGLRVFVAENHNAPVFTMRVYVKAGSIYEQEFLGAGISHFCEHLVSGGTTHKRPEAESQRILRSIGKASNAYTTSDHTCYYISTSAAYMDSVIDLLSDWTLNAAITQEEFDREQGVITREIQMGRDEPRRRIGKLYNGAMFVEHPEHYPTIGYLELFNEITRDDIITYVDRMYVPANMHVVAVGDFDAEEVMDKIEAAFGQFPYRAPPSIILPVDRKQLGQKYIEDEMDIELTYMTLGFRTVPLGHEDVYPLHVLSRVLGSGRSSRLYQRVKEDLNLVYSIDAYSYNPQYEAPDFTVHAQLDYENVKPAKQAILEVIDGLRSKYVGRSELQKAKTQIASEDAYARQDVEGQASAIGIDVLRTGNANYSDYYLERIKGVTREDIKRVVNTYLYEDAITLAVLRPLGVAVEKTEREMVSGEKSPVTKSTLPSGATLLLKEDHNVPLVHIRAYFKGGSRLEEERNNGAFNMMARMLRRGTRRRSAESIAEEVDAMGARLGTGSSEDHFQITMDVLSENFEEGLELVADLIINSTFDDGEFEKERQTVVAMLKQRNDTWDDDGEVRMRRALYGGHPYGMDPRGEEASVGALTRDEVYDLYLDYCAPSNMVLAVFGDIESEDARTMVEKAFARFNREGVRVPPPPEWAGLEGEVLRPEPTEKEQAVIFMGFPGMDAGSPDWYAMRVLDGVISGIGYPGGWLHSTLRGQQLVYVVHAWNYTLEGRGYIALMAATAPETADTALAIINEKIDKIKNDYVTDEELEMSKRACTIMEDLYFSQTTAAQATLAAQYELMGLGYDHRDGMREKIHAVTREDVREVARKYLNNPATVLIKPELSAYETSMR
jgi:zinc protease